MENALIPLDVVLDDATFSPADIESHPLRIVGRWAVEYLASPHPQLGRPGPVCPWSPPSMVHRLFWLRRIDTRGVEAADVERAVLSLIDAFRACEPREGARAQFKTIVAVLPDLEGPDSVVSLHEKLKPAFLDAGLMLGEFFATCDKRGLHNREFRPLRSPLPLLVVRDMLEFDIVFLAERMEYIRPYLRKHDHVGRRAARELLAHTSDVGLSADALSVLSSLVQSWDDSAKPDTRASMDAST